MKGLIKKDLFILKNNMKSFILLSFIYIACCLNSDGIEAFIIPFMMAMLCISTFSYDEFNKWDAYAITLPGDRSSIIKAKYAVALILIVLSFFATILLSFIIGTIRNNFDFNNTLVYTLTGMGTGLFVISFIYPLIIKFGLEKGRIGIMIGAFGLSGLLAFLGTTIKIPAGTLAFLERILPIALPLIVAIIFTISYFLSKRIYAKKEF